jgi:hypothetical protein
MCYDHCHPREREASESAARLASATLSSVSRIAEATGKRAADSDASLSLSLLPSLLPPSLSLSLSLSLSFSIYLSLSGART